MFDNEPKNANDILEIQQPEAPEEQEAAEEVVQEQPQKTTEDTREANLQALREQKKIAQRERDEALRRLRELEAAQKAPQQPEEDLSINLAPDDIAEGKHLTKVGRKIKMLEDQLKAYQQQSALQTTEARLKAQYPDFDNVVSRENVELLKERHPEIAYTLQQSQDLYSTGVSAYTLIKKLGIQQEQIYDADKQLAQRNAAKPRPLTSVAPQQGDSPMSRANAFANGLTDELKTQLRKEMAEAMKNNK